ncbi:MAG: hypothetical protein KAJ25_01470 [Desulfobacula sp.]|nr:hypothetical protein [Desulfobacula sp.]
MKTEKGLIGFFDVLGYQNLLENNEPEIIADTVLPILTNLKKTVPDRMKDNIRKSAVGELVSPKTGKKTKAYLWQWFVFIKKRTINEFH